MVDSTQDDIGTSPSAHRPTITLVLHRAPLMRVDCPLSDEVTARVEAVKGDFQVYITFEPMDMISTLMRPRANLGAQSAQDLGKTIQQVLDTRVHGNIVKEGWSFDFIVEPAGIRIDVRGGKAGSISALTSLAAAKFFSQTLLKAAPYAAKYRLK